LAIRHAPVEGSERNLLPGSSVIRRSNPGMKLDVVVKIRRKRKLPELSGPPPRAMKRKTLARNYGAAAKDIARIKKAFKKGGLRSGSADRAARTVRLRGTVAQLEATFQTRLFEYAHPDGDYRGRVGALHVPSGVRNIVEGVFGLDSRRVARRRHQPSRVRSRTLTSPVPAPWYAPQDLAKRYNFPEGDGANQTVAILEFGGGYFPKDLEKFCDLVGVLPPNVRTVSIDDTSTANRDGNEGDSRDLPQGVACCLFHSMDRAGMALCARSARA
jgi:kumamolisin